MAKSFRERKEDGVMKVSNQKCIRRLSLKNMMATKARNIIAIIAIALTTLLFTALFTIVMSISKGYEQSNFRMVGTYAHGEFKRLSEEQYRLLKEDEAIKEYGLRRVVGIGSGQVFLKNYTEISFMDENTAKWGFTNPTIGKMPKEGTREAAADTRVLHILNVPLELGTEFSITMDVDGKEITESFVLCGWWEHDLVSPASNVLIPHSRLEEIFEELNTEFIDESIGSYMMTVMLKDSKDIYGELTDILSRYGFVALDKSAENYVSVGVNWGYASEGLFKNLEAGTLLSISLILLVIVLTGYLIIYNVFRISVANEIRHYGMLKTIGTTGTQIRKIILIQALLLSVVGIPVGIILGWGTGAVLTPFVIQELNGIVDAGISINPVIFVFSAIFAVITVLISCFKPSKIAGYVSPVEALRYTEVSSNSKFRLGKKGTSLWGMAAANLSGRKGRTRLTVLSLSLSVLLFTLTVTFVNSFSIDKYLSGMAVADFQVSCAEYFNVSVGWSRDNAMSMEAIEEFYALEGVTDSGTTYGIDAVDSPMAFLEEEIVRARLKYFGYDDAMTEEYINSEKEYSNHYKDGLYQGKVADVVQILGMDPFCTTKLTVIEGDLAKLFEDEKAVAVTADSLLKVGDKIVVSYSDKIEFMNKRTKEVYSKQDDIPTEEWLDIIVNRECHEEEYTIVAKVGGTDVLGYRSSWGEKLILSSREMLANAPKAAPLYYLIDTEDEMEAEVESFMAQYTENSILDYESKTKVAEEFASFSKMFLVLGCTLSLVVALVGILNFINIVLTGIVSRRKELATLQAIGMTGSQLCKMLVYEGLIYTAGAAVIAVVLNVLTIPMGNVVEKIFWFCEFRYTMLPMLVSVPVLAGIGILVPVITYRILIRKSVVERLREAE